MHLQTYEADQEPSYKSAHYELFCGRMNFGITRVAHYRWSINKPVP